MRHHFLWITAFVVFLASFSMNGIARTSCKDHYYETECTADPSCNWESGKKSKCEKKEATTGCASHKSEFYCEANHCTWDTLSTGNKCTESTREHH